MTSFSVSVPFSGEALSVYKSLSDVFSSSFFSPEKITRQFDDSATFSYPVTLGVFRVLLDGECQIADQDFEDRVSLMKISAKDRGGKGRVEALVRLNVGTNDEAMINCECDVTSKGMLARVPIDFSDVFSDKIHALITHCLEENDNVVVISDFEPRVETSPEIATAAVDLIDVETLSALFESGNLRGSEPKKRVWVAILSFPVTVISWPIKAIRSFFSSTHGISFL